MNKKLTDEDQKLIIQLVKEREKAMRAARRLTNKRIAEKFDVHIGTIRRTIKMNIEKWGTG